MPRDPLLVAEMLEAARRIVELIGDRSAPSLDEDRERREALLWNFTVLGEAASQVSVELRSQYAGIEWNDPIRLRNRIVHGYWSVDIEVLIDTANDDLPVLIQSLEAVVGTFK